MFRTCKRISDRTRMDRTVWVYNYAIRLYAYGQDPADEMLITMTNDANKRRA